MNDLEEILSKKRELINQDLIKYSTPIKNLENKLNELQEKIKGFEMEIKVQHSLLSSFDGVNTDYTRQLLSTKESATINLKSINEVKSEIQSQLEKYEIEFNPLINKMKLELNDINKSL